MATTTETPNTGIKTFERFLTSDSIITIHISKQGEPTTTSISKWH